MSASSPPPFPPSDLTSESFPLSPEEEKEIEKEIEADILAAGQAAEALGNAPADREKEQPRSEQAQAQSPPDSDPLHGRARRGIKMLMGRQIVLQAVTFGGGVVLARTLGPAQFGLYAMATYLVQIVAQFGDFGLAPSFIQRKRELSERDLQVGFTLQQAITTLIVLLLLLAAPQLARLYPKAPPLTVWLVRALAFDLFLTSWRTMSALQLERHLRYDRLALIEVVEVLTYQGLAVGLAVTGHGVWSFVWATLARGVLGTLLIYMAAPWRIRLAFDRQAAIEILRFGVPFQAQALTNQLGAWVTPLLVGSLIGPNAVGLLIWASSNGKKPLILVDNVMRVAFAHFARIQDDAATIERILTRYLTQMLLASGLWFSVLLVAGTPLVTWIYTMKWLAAVPALILSGAALLLDVISMVVCVTLNATGKVNKTTQIVLLRALIQIAVSVPLVLLIGYNGVPIAYLFNIGLALPLMFHSLGAGVSGRVFPALAWVLIPIFAACGLGVILMRGIARLTALPPPAMAILALVAVCIIYGLTAWVVAPAWIKAQARTPLLAALRRVTGRRHAAGANAA